MSSLELIFCVTGVFFGQEAQKQPSPDRLVKVKVQDMTLPAPAHQDFRRVKETMLLIDRINFGFQYQQPSDARAQGQLDKDFSRFAGCYFHPDGPAGIALKKI